MPRPKDPTAAPRYSDAVAWFCELARALERRDGESETLARRSLDALGVEVIFRPDSQTAMSKTHSRGVDSKAARR
jgi:hypothetical protein